MIEDQQSQQAQNRRQRALLGAALAGGPVLILCVLALGVTSLGWLPTIAGVYALSAVLLVALFMSEHRTAGRRDPEHAQTDEDR